MDETDMLDTEVESQISALEDENSSLENEIRSLRADLEEFRRLDPFARLLAAADSELVNWYLLREALDEMELSDDAARRTIARIGQSALTLLESV